MYITGSSVHDEPCWNCRTFTICKVFILTMPLSWTSEIIVLRETMRRSVLIATAEKPVTSTVFDLGPVRGDLSDDTDVSLLINQAEDTVSALYYDTALVQFNARV